MRRSAAAKSEFASSLIEDGGESIDGCFAEEARRQNKKPARRRPQDPPVQQVLRTFGGEIVDVKLVSS